MNDEFLIHHSSLLSPVKSCQDSPEKSCELCGQNFSIMHTTLQQKRAIIELSNLGKTSPAIAEELGLSVRVVRKWRQLGKKRGSIGACSRSPQKWGDGFF